MTEHNVSADMSDLEKLLNFCVNNEDLNKLEAILGEFNPLRVLGVENFEIRHSNVLGWLIDPKAHHGLGDSIFKSILLQVLKENERGDLPKVSDVIDVVYSDLKILREWKNIDLLAVSEANKLVLVIENKIYAGEEETQLTRYADIVKEKYPKHTRVHIFLTLDGAEPRGSDLFVPFKHEQIYSIVKSVTNIRRDYINAKVYDFIQQYLNILEVKIMKNEKLNALCSKLYREHKDAIKMINELGKPKLESQHINIFHMNTKTMSFRGGEYVTYYGFIPTAWNNIVPETNLSKTDRYLIYFYFDFSRYDDNKITLYLYVGDFPDPAERKRFMEQISEAAEQNKNLRIKRNANRIFTKPIYENDEKYDLDDYTSVIDRLIKAYNSDEVQDVLKTIDSVVQKFWGGN
jgi:hypothetical protein